MRIRHLTVRLVLAAVILAAGPTLLAAPAQSLATVCSMRCCAGKSECCCRSGRAHDASDREVSRQAIGESCASDCAAATAGSFELAKSLGAVTALLFAPSSEANQALRPIYIAVSDRERSSRPRAPPAFVAL